MYKECQICGVRTPNAESMAEHVKTHGAPSFEMANADDPKGIIEATQRSIMASMRGVIEGVKNACGGPGMTWSQIDYLLKGFEDKQPVVITQEHEQ